MSANHHRLIFGSDGAQDVTPSTRLVHHYSTVYGQTTILTGAVRTCSTTAESGVGQLALDWPKRTANSNPPATTFSLTFVPSTADEHHHACRQSHLKQLPARIVGAAQVCCYLTLPLQPTACPSYHNVLRSLFIASVTRVASTIPLWTATGTSPATMASLP